MIIGHIQQLLSGLRSSTRKAADDKKIGQEKMGVSNSAPVELNKLSIVELEHLITQKICSLNESDPEYYSKAIQIFVESAIEWEYGSTIYQDNNLENITKGAVKKIIDNDKTKRHYRNIIDKMR